LDIKNLYDFVLIFLTLRIALLSYEDGIVADRLPERVRFEGNVVESLFQGDVVQIEIEVLGAGYIDTRRIEEHVDPGQLSNAFE
jgi:hypothetical protein